MQCEEIQELIYLEAAGAADSAMVAAVRAHLATGCLACQATMAEAMLASAQLPLNLAPCPPSSKVKDELMQRVKSVAASSGAIPAGPARPPAQKPTTGKLLMWPLVISSSIAAAFLLIAVLGLQTNQQLTNKVIGDVTTLHQLKKSLAHEVAQSKAISVAMKNAITSEHQKIAVLKTELTAARGVEKMIGSPAMEMASLRGMAPMRTAWGRVMWNGKMKMWKLCAFNLPHLPKSKTYEVWMITAHGKKMPAGLFNTSRKTQSVMMTPHVPPNPHAMAEIAVTVEPAGGSPRPTGAVLLTGRIG